MKKTWRQFMFALGLIGCFAMVASACVVRARVRPVHVVDSEPPPPRYRTVQPRSGYVWIRGHWQYLNGKWKWKVGHWERARSGYAWQPGHWERRGNRYHWVEGRWAAGGTTVRDHRRPAPAPAPTPKVRDHRTPAPPAYPTTAPPAPRYQTPAARSGYVWVRGRYDWKGRWVWTAGHWERAKSGMTWEPGRWERRGDRYVWVAGRWVKAAPTPKTRDHRNKQPPPPARKNERVPARRAN